MIRHTEPVNVTMLQCKQCNTDIVACLRDGTSELMFCCKSCSRVWWTNITTIISVPLFEWKLAGE